VPCRRVALNCTAERRHRAFRPVRNIFVQPAANDEGCSVGAALIAAAQHGELPPPAAARWKHVYWGPEYSPDEVLHELEGFREQLMWEKPVDIAAAAAREIAQGKVVGWFQGRMEFGPRSLGNRSILADPRDAGMKDKINEKVKRREAFRPFAPAVVEEDAEVYFDMTGLRDSPFMLFHGPSAGAPTRGDSGGHARRRHGACADGVEGNESRVLESHHGVQESDGGVGRAGTPPTT